MLKRSLLLSVLLLGVAPVAGAAGVDLTKPLLCAVTEALSCVHDGTCERGNAEDLNIPTFVRVDAQAKTLSEYKGERSTPIQSVQRHDGVLVLQGVERRAWSMSISAASGRMSVAATEEGAGFVVFGACTEL